MKRAILTVTVLGVCKILTANFFSIQNCLQISGNNLLLLIIFFFSDNKHSTLTILTNFREFLKCLISKNYLVTSADWKPTVLWPNQMFLQILGNKLLFFNYFSDYEHNTMLLYQQGTVVQKQSGRLLVVWSSPHISKTTKLQLFEACLKSFLPYGSEIWFLPNTITQKLQIFINKCLRIMCWIFWPYTISYIELKKLNRDVPRMETQRITN